MKRPGGDSWDRRGCSSSGSSGDSWDRRGCSGGNRWSRGCSSISNMGVCAGLLESSTGVELCTGASSRLVPYCTSCYMACSLE